MKNKSVLHIAPQNTAGVPLTLVKTEQSLGFHSRLITLMKNTQNREEDICLNLPFIHFWGTKAIKKWVTPKHRRRVVYQAEVPETIPKPWISSNFIEKGLIHFRESLWTSQIVSNLQKTNIEQFDIIQLDGGLGFYRDGRLIREWKLQGKKIVCCYMGSDLRTRGVIPEIDAISDLNLTVEFDHLQHHPDIHHIPFPLDLSRIQYMNYNKRNKGPVRIGHAPTHRAAKGSNLIIPVLKRLEQKLNVEIVLIEGLPYEKALEVKGSCDLFVDQIGNLGYGINGIEALAMGIPTFSSLATGFADVYSKHPFLEITIENLEETIIPYIENESRRKSTGEKSRKWVKDIHDAFSVVKKAHQFIDKIL